MKLFRNPLVKKPTLYFLLLTLLGGLAAYLCFGLLPTLLAMAMGAGGFLIFFFYNRARYNAIAALSSECDRVLHGEYHLDIDSGEEGELSILEHEIYKMTVTLREQADILKRDKIYLSDSISDISHQLRTPLTSLSLIHTLLRSPELAPEKRVSLTRDMGVLLERMEWLVAALLKISKLDTGTASFDQRAISVRELIAEASAPLAIPMEIRKQCLSIDCPEGITYTGDFAWSVEAMENILKNCMEHTPAGGTIQVSARETPIFTAITIRDTGPGIDPEDLPHIFERFYRGKNADPSSFGIGLNLARMIVLQQNGTIRAENLRGGGASFTIQFYKLAV